MRTLKKVLAFLLISGLVHAQQSSGITDQQPCPEPHKVPPGPGFSVAERHDFLRRGQTEDFAVLLCSPQLLYGGCGVTRHPQLQGITPVSLIIDNPSGITIFYRNGRKYLPLIAGTPAYFTRKSGVLLLRMTAGGDAPVGIHRLHGSLQYQSDKPGMPPTSQTLEINFWVKVVTPDAAVAENEWPFTSHIGQHVKDVALAPLAPFQWLLFVIVCGTGSCDI